MLTQKEYFLRIQEEAKKRKNKLIIRSAKVLLSLGVAQLNKKGIKRAAFQYEMFNQYPPFFLQKNISEQKIFSNNSLLVRQDKKDPFALYVHLPFCIKKCAFCCYFSKVNWSYRQIDNYLSCLEKEISLLLKKDYMRNRKVSSIYWGGGTPTVLTCKQINRLARIFRENFDIIPNAELICETTTNSATPDKLKCLLENGFNRLSIGVQTFDEKLLKLYNRLYTPEEAIKSFNLARRIGFSHINIDLMFGLAGQTVYDWGETLKIAKDLRPANVTVYPFTDSFGETAMYRKPGSYFPSEAERLLMHVMAIEKLLEAGYIQITPYQFILSWKYPYAHQEHKAKNGEIYALGVTGHSFVGRCDYFNQSTLTRYKSLLAQNKLPIERGRCLSKKELMIRFAIYGLQKTSGLNRKNGGIDKSAFKKRFGITLERAFKGNLDKLERLGLISNSKGHVKLSYKGLLHPVETSLLFYAKKDRAIVDRLSLSSCHYAHILR